MLVNSPSASARAEARLVFALIHTSSKVRLARGAAERKRVFEALGATGAVESYRYEWLQSAIANCIRQMAYAAQEFNDMYPHDQCSVQDLVDVLEMSIEKLRNP